MIVRFAKGDGKPDTLTCVRDDGSRTWSALNFTTHDFGHYALETAAGWRDAFFGLLAQGWDVADFAARDPQTGHRRAVPAQAMQAEALAGLLDMERRPGPPPPHETFVAMLTSACDGLGVPSPIISPDLLQAVRSRQAHLLRRWEQVRPGEALELPF